MPTATEVAVTVTVPERSESCSPAVTLLTVQARRANTSRLITFRDIRFILLSLVQGVWTIASADPAEKPVYPRAAAPPARTVDALSKPPRLVPLCDVCTAPSTGSSLSGVLGSCLLSCCGFEAGSRPRLQLVQLSLHAS